MIYASPWFQRDDVLVRIVYPKNIYNLACATIKDINYNHNCEYPTVCGTVFHWTSNYECLAQDCNFFFSIKEAKNFCDSKLKNFGYKIMLDKFSSFI